MTRVFDEHFARTPFSWSPINMKLTARNPWFYLHLGNSLYLQWNLLPDWDERALFQLGRWYITRPETPEEEALRQDEEAELDFMEAESNRYIDWSY